MLSYRNVDGVHGQVKFRNPCYSIFQHLAAAALKWRQKSLTRVFGVGQQNLLGAGRSVTNDKLVPTFGSKHLMLIAKRGQTLCTCDF